MPSCCQDSAGSNRSARFSVTTRRIAVVGNPNCGKTTVFNALTGLRQKVGNYAGVTVERKEGTLRTAPGETITLIDLPGMYSLTSRSPDEAIARDVLLGRRDDMSAPDAIINVVDAANLERNLYLTSQILELNLPTLVILTMTDVARRRGERVDEQALSRRLGVPVLSVAVRSRSAVSDVQASIGSLPARLPEDRPMPYVLPAVVREECEELSALVRDSHPDSRSRGSFAEAVYLLMTDGLSHEDLQRHTPELLSHLDQDKAHFRQIGVDFPETMVEARYAWIEEIVRDVLHPVGHGGFRGAGGGGTGSFVHSDALAETIDRVLLHRFWGSLIFLTVMAIVFQSVFSWAQAPTNWISSGVSCVGQFLTAHMPAGSLRDLIVQGILGGVGTTIEFLPQILVLFFFISLLEDTGYLARAAFLMDKVMSRVGLHGKSFIPLLSSFACAIPGIMATRTIDDRKSPQSPVMLHNRSDVRQLLGLRDGMIAAFGMAWVFKNTLLKGAAPRFLLELPPYHLPSWRAILIQILERSGIFLKRAGTIILSVSIVIWFLSSYPKLPGATPQRQLSQSYAGHLGHLIEPVIKPLGFDWRIGVSLVSSFVAREVFVSSMGTIYSVGDKTSDPDQVSMKLQSQLRADPYFSPLLAICITVYYVLAMQCLSTVAVVKRETGGWKWPLFQIGYMTALAWIVTFVVWHVGKWLGY